VTLETEQHHLHTRLNALLARPPEAPLAEPERLRPLPAPARLDYATLAERVRARNPVLASEGSKLKAAEKSRELAYRNRYPDFTIGAGPIQYQSAVREWEVMVEMNIPLQQSARRSQERESEAMLAAARSRREASSNQGARRTGREPCRHRRGASYRSPGHQRSAPRGRPDLQGRPSPAMKTASWTLRRYSMPSGRFARPDRTRSRRRPKDRRAWQKLNVSWEKIYEAGCASCSRRLDCRCAGGRRWLLGRQAECSRPCRRDAAGCRRRAGSE
jgi:hypothetical protein